MLDRQKELSDYRIQQAEESLLVAKTCLENGINKDSINRSYYSVFYAIKAVLALGTVDFKRHKDVIAYFNKEYVASEKFPKLLGRKIGNSRSKRIFECRIKRRTKTPMLL